MSENIYTAINAVMRQVGYVKKERTTGLNYSFAGEASLIEALRPAMVEAGILVHANAYQVVSETEYTTAKGAKMVNVRVLGEFLFTHAPSGTQIKVVELGEGSDSSDKAVNKAMTGAYKYALRQTFCIETGDDPDKERHDRAAALKQPAPAGQQAGKVAQPVQHETSEQHQDLTAEQTETVERLITSLQSAGNREYTANDPQRNLLRHVIDDVVFNDANAHHMILKVVFGNPSVKEITGGQTKAILDWLKPVKDSSGEYTTDKGKQLKAIMRYAEVADGQMMLFEQPAMADA